MTTETKPEMRSGKIDGLGFFESEKYRSRRTEVSIHNTRAPNDKARFAMALIERWGMVAGVHDGQDSAGRAKSRLMAVEEVVKRAFDTAVACFAEMESRGWMLELPEPQTIEEKD